jgi:hypothetical protein
VNGKEEEVVVVADQRLLKDNTFNEVKGLLKALVGGLSDL